MARMNTLRVTLAAMAGAAVVTAWAGVGAAYFLDAPRSFFVIGVIIAAIATEAAFWLVLFLLGWSAVANRHWLVRLFSKQAKSGDAEVVERRA